jgi:hypothetical protein
VLAIDGRSNSGKTTLAARIRDMVPGSAVVHTDDIAWEHSRFGWADLLIDGILIPVRHGQGVRYRPPRWDEHGREGSIEVPAGCPLLIIEGDGAGRREVAHLIDTLIWVQADEREAGRRAAERAADPPAADLANRAADGDPFDEAGWMAEEVPFNAAQRMGTRRHHRLRQPGDPLRPGRRKSSSHRRWLHPLIAAGHNPELHGMKRPYTAGMAN